MSPAQAHDIAVRYIAANRFPFPDQTDWPADNLTVTNETDRRQPIDTPKGEHFPDIVIVSTAGEIREVGEVETEVADSHVEHWSWGSEAADDRTSTGVKHFFVYVPAGTERQATGLLDGNAISYAGVRGYRVDESGRVEIVPFVTRGHPKDHRP